MQASLQLTLFHQVIAMCCSLQAPQWRTKAGQPISLSLLCKAPMMVPDIKEEEVGRTGSKGRGAMGCSHFPRGEFNAELSHSHTSSSSGPKKYCTIINNRVRSFQDIKSIDVSESLGALGKWPKYGDY